MIFVARLIVIAIFIFIACTFSMVGYGVYRVSNGLDFDHGISGVFHHLWTGNVVSSCNVYNATE